MRESVRTPDYAEPLDRDIRKAITVYSYKLIDIVSHKIIHVKFIMHTKIYL